MIYMSKEIMLSLNIFYPTGPIINQPAEPNVEINSRRSQCIRNPALLDDYVYPYESNINIGSDDPNSFDEALSYSEVIIEKQ